MKSMMQPKKGYIVAYYAKNHKIFYHFCCNESNLIHYSEDEA